MEEEQVDDINHWMHKHPLTLMESHGECGGCGVYLTGREPAYGCSKKCGDKTVLHQACAEMPFEIIRHPRHPHHKLTQFFYGHFPLITNPLDHKCGVCEKSLDMISYVCHSENCGFGIHLRCGPSMGVVGAADERKQKMNHASHPEHELRLLKRNRRLCSFTCDACGGIGKGNSYVCTSCQLMIHETCASLPTTMPTAHHQHALSLAFCLPPPYIKFGYKCDLCREDLQLKHWAYHCELCSFVAHIKCATSPATSS